MAPVEPPYTNAELDAIEGDVKSCHMRLSVRMATHLKLTIENWPKAITMSAQMLCLNPGVAQEGARAFRELLRSRLLNPNSATKYEQYWTNNAQLMHELDLFCDAAPPCLLHHCRGRFATCFRFLARKFLAGPDDVTACESAHAQWKWFENNCRGISFPLLNACIKLQTYLRLNGNLPELEQLQPWIDAERRTMREEYMQIVADGVVQGQRVHALYAERFNITPMVVNLLTLVHAPITAVVEDYHFHWGQYLRFLFESSSFYCFTNVDSRRVLFVGESKAFAGRAAIGEGEGVGRALAVAWFEVAERTPDGIRARPCALNGASLVLTTASLAEIACAAGYNPPVAPNASARDVEIQHNRAFLSHDIVLYRQFKRSDDERAPWEHILSDEIGIEPYFFDERHEAWEDYSIMALSRYVQVRDGLTEDQHKRVFDRCRKAHLLAAIGGGALPAMAAAPAAPPPDPAPAAPPPAPAAAPAVAAPAVAGGARGRGRGGCGVGARGRAGIARGRRGRG